MTRLLYLHDTYQMTAHANVQHIFTLGDGRIVVILDQTIFYPQGGGQPCDTGFIASSAGRFAVTDVRLDEQGVVQHMGTWEQGAFAPGDTVELSIDQARRLLHATLHSAGHLIDCAVTEMELALKPGKGYHFAQGPYVEYEGAIDGGEELMRDLQAKLDNLTHHPIPIFTKQLSADEARELGVMAPPGKPARIVYFEGFAPCGCGGTHVRSSQEIGKISIRKIKAKAGIVRISYEVA